MASQEEYSPEFKAKVAAEALAQDRKNLDKLSAKYDVPVSLILTWASKYEKDPESFETSDAPVDEAHESEEDTVVRVDVDDEEISESISHGVMGDNLNVKKLTFWSVLGIIFVIVFIQLLKEMYDQTTQINMERLSAQSEYYDVNAQEKKDRERLSTYGVVNVEEGIYRIPIDSVISKMAADGE
jgi:transposase-like protein